MEIHEAIITGIKRGVDRRWRYAKNIIEIKPEYLLTISVADQLTDGFLDISGLDVEIHLEERTRSVVYDAVIRKVGLEKYMAASRKGALRRAVTRPGKVDIHFKTDSESYAAELKNINPSYNDLRKEAVRLGQFLMVNGGVNSCAACYLAFPCTTDRKSWIESAMKKESDPRVSFKVYDEYVVTNEDPEDGIPAYYAYCVKFWR